MAPTSLADRGDEIMARAERLRVDPLAVAAHLALDAPDLIYRRAAAVLGLAFEDELADKLLTLEETADTDRLGQIASCRGVRGGREVLFFTPRLDQVMALRAGMGSHPRWRQRLCVVPPRALREGLAAANAQLLLTGSRQGLSRRYPLAGAHLDLPLTVRLGFVAFLLCAIAASAVTIPILQPLLLAPVAIALIAPSIFRLWAAFSLSDDGVLQARGLLADAALPSYAVLIPLRDEAHMVRQSADAMRRLDYPAEKLEIIFVVESASAETVLAARRETHDPRFSLLVVPEAPPHTKPKALNFALPLVRAERVVVFDAEDVPDPAQLRQAATLFAEDPQLECLQAELRITNGHRNWIAHMFAAEYAGHFGVLLPAIGRAGLPMPLGGTSNHFRTATLRKLGGWDAFNVTEDADLGIRMTRLGMKLASFAGITWEEAPETAGAWARQRSRWTKGWMQTVLVHSRRPANLLTDLGWKGLSAFYIFVGGMVLAIAMHGLFLVRTLMQLLADIVSGGTPAPLTLAGLLSLVIGYCGAAVVSVVALERLGRGGRLMVIVSLPAYWLLGWYALVLAAIELIIRPYHWAKTPHIGRGLAGSDAPQAPDLEVQHPSPTHLPQ
ncbi:glycosyltransferase [Pelagibacterium lacus]|uniref:glycosyltransferase n=1 Tax=Pelagibacterium lacus TaxID=2282655 RepID=UPI001314F745|nr:glycosyltransferase [Pelagibacterium lacus]